MCKPFVDHVVKLLYNQRMGSLPPPSAKRQTSPDLDPIALATIAGTVIAWIMLIASFSDAAYSMIRRLDDAVLVARTGAANISLDEIISKSTMAKYLISLYFILGAVVAPVMVLASTLFRRSSRHSSKLHKVPCDHTGDCNE